MRRQRVHHPAASVLQTRQQTTLDQRPDVDDTVLRAGRHIIVRVVQRAVDAVLVVHVARVPGKRDVRFFSMEIKREIGN